MEKLRVVLRTLTPVHTGDVDRRSREVQVSGIRGSIRWWYEALVRGMGGYACDPTGPDSCRFDYHAYRVRGEVDEGLRDVCPACRTFGCTGWKSKFHMRITDVTGKVGDIRLDRPGMTFVVEFLPVKEISQEETWLLSKAMWLISEYGSIGGRTTLKPPKFKDLGLVELVEPMRSEATKEDVEWWLGKGIDASESIAGRLSRMPPEHPDLRYFFFNRGRWLDAKSMNELVAVDPSGFMRGKIGESKKVFSFSRGRRFWGYTSGEEMLSSVLEKLLQMGIKGTVTGKEVIDEL